MSDTNRTKLGWVKEILYGVMPPTPAFRNLRIKSSGLTIAPKYKESAELRTDRMIGDEIHIADEAGGPVPMEVSWGSLDPLFEFALQSLWNRTPVRDNNGTPDSVVTDVSAGTGIYTVTAAAVPATDQSAAAFAIGHLVRAVGFTAGANSGLFRASAGSNISVTLGNASVAEPAPPGTARLKVVGFRGVAGDITATAGGLGSTLLNLTTLGLAIGQWIKIGGATVIEQFTGTPANNNWARITGIAAGALSLDNLPAGWGVDAGAAKTITVYIGDYIRNGLLSMSMAFEQQYPDLAVPEYDYLVGESLDQLAMTFKSNDIIEATATFVGADGSNVTARVAGATDIAAPTNDVLNTAANVGQIQDNGITLAGQAAVTSLDLTLMNSVRRKGGLGSFSSTDIGLGAFRLNAKMSMYYASNVIRQKLLNSIASSWNMRIVDTTAPVNSRAYVLDIPKLKYKVGNPNNPGIDTDRTIDPEFSALAHPTFGYAFQLQRLEEYYPLSS